MGFSSDQATTALRQSEGNVQGAIHSLLSNGTETGPPPPAASHPYPHGGGGAGPAGRGGDSGRGRGVGRGAGHDNREHRPGTVDRATNLIKVVKSKGVFTSSESGSESRKDQRTRKKMTNIRENSCFRSVRCK